MKKLFFILIFGVLLKFSDGQAAGNDALRRQCLAKIPYPKVTIKYSLGKLEYDFSYEERDLAINGRDGYSGLSHTPEKNFYTNFKVRHVTLPNNVKCYYPDEIVLNIYAGNSKIDIAKNVNKNSCYYQVLMRHEQTHQYIDMSIFEYYLPVIKKRFLSTIAGNSVIIKSPKDRTGINPYDEYNKMFNNVLAPVFETMKKARKIESAKLDTSENYNHEAYICYMVHKKFGYSSGI